MQPHTNARRPARGFEIETRQATLTPDRVLARQTPVGFLCVGIAKGGRFLKAASQDRRVKAILNRAAEVVEHQRPRSNLLGDFDDPYLRRLDLFAKLSKDFNPDQPRDDHGRWTSDGASGAPAAFSGPPEAPGTPSLLGAAARATSAFLQRVAPATLDALELVATRFSAATAFFGIIFIPTNRSLITTGTLPDSDVRFDFDQEARTLTLYRFDENRQKQIVAEAKPDDNGVLRDETGRAIGRVLDGSVILEPRTINDPELRSTVDDDEPRLCPAPTEDRPGWDSSEEAARYQAYVSKVVNPTDPLAPGLAVRLSNPKTGDWVYYDDCRLSDGTMIDAKSRRYDYFLNSAPEFLQNKVEGELLSRARRQVSAAGTRQVEWYFAESGAADHMRAVFQREGIPIKVVWLPPPWAKKQITCGLELANSIALILAKTKSMGGPGPIVVRA